MKRIRSLGRLRLIIKEIIKEQRGRRRLSYAATIDPKEVERIYLEEGPNRAVRYIVWHQHQNNKDTRISTARAIMKALVPKEQQMAARSQEKAAESSL